MTQLRINNIPSPTWHFLKLNDVRVEWEQPCAGASLRGDGTDADTNRNSIAELFGQDGTELLFAGGNTSAVSVTAAENEEKQARVDIGDEGESRAAEVFINAAENSSVTAYINVSGSGMLALRVNALAAEGARVKLVFTQLTQHGGRLIAQIWSKAESGAAISAAHFYPGSEGTYISSQTMLAGDESAFDSQTYYLCSGAEKLDMNYNVIHLGKRTTCEVSASGALSDGGAKTFRGTIDLRKGSSGSSGNETENVLLLSDDVSNKTLPVILCGEEDVNGAHGATIGDISDETLLYFASRGISRELAEKILKDSVSQAFCRHIGDEETTRLVSARTGISE